MDIADSKTPHIYTDPDILNRCLIRLGINVCHRACKVDVFLILRYVQGYLK